MIRQQYKNACMGLVMSPAAICEHLKSDDSKFFLCLSEIRKSVYYGLSGYLVAERRRTNFIQRKKSRYICFIHFSKERSKRSMKDLVHIRKTDISVKEHKGQLVAIFRKIDTVYMIDQTEETLNQRKKFNRGDTRKESILQLLTRAIFIERVFSWGSKLESQ